MDRRRGVIALITDFGTAGHHVGVMKGVILSRDREVAVVDVCHEIPPGDIEEGALNLLWSCIWFPPGTVHLTVVDPGVGSDRRPLAARAGGHFFVGPDNGVLAPALAASGKAEIFEITVDGDERLSATFHGRDVFAPAAARLACGEQLEAIGRKAGETVGLELPSPRETVDGTLEGEIVSIDRFGNLITSITRHHLEKAGLGRTAEIALGDGRIVGLVDHYAAGREGEASALINSSGHLEIAVNQGRASDCLSLGKGAAVRVRNTGVRP